AAQGCRETAPAAEERRLPRQRSSGSDRRNAAHVHRSFSLPRVIGLLHPDPDAGPVAKQLAEANGDRRRYRLLLVDDVIEVLARDAEKGSNLGLRLPRRRNDILSKHGARVGGAPSGARISSVFGHWWSCPAQSPL